LSTALHIAHVHDRLSVRSGADLHLLMLLAEQRASLRLSLAVGWKDGTATAPDGVTTKVVRDLGDRDGKGEAAARRLLRWLDAQAPDVVHIHNVMQAQVISAVASRWPTVMTVQDHRVFCPGRGKWTLDEQVCADAMSAEVCAACFQDSAYGAQMLGRTQARLAAATGLRRVIVLSEYMKRELVAVGVEAARIAVVPASPFGAQPLGATGPAEAPIEGPFWIAAGRWVRAKGFHLLLEAWGRLNDPLPLVLVGAGPEADTLRAQRSKLADRDRVHLVDWVERERLHAWVRSAQALLFTSLWQEPFGLAGVEALALGTPVVAFESGAVAEWLDPAIGWPVPWGDVGALALALNEARDPAECARRGALGQGVIAQRFDAQRAAQAVIDTYASAVCG